MNRLINPIQHVAKHVSRQRFFSTSVRRDIDFTHTVIGAGAVGLAIARKLSAHDNTSTLLIEKHGAVGTETSSRNSEVIHAGLYYGHDSLKTKLCLRGKQLMYEACAKHSIPHWNCGKWIVAQDRQQWDELVKVFNFAREMEIPIKFVKDSQIKALEPALRAEAGVLESTTTGIVDSHALMTWLEGEFLDNGGDVALQTQVVGVRKIPGGYAIDTANADGKLNDPITTEAIINSGGLFAASINNMVLPADRAVTPYYAKGTYFSYAGTQPKPKRLIYPAPVPGHGGLGTHLTLDLSNPPRVRFGPDVEWVDDPTDYTPNKSRVEEAIRDIKTYLPTLEEDKIEVDYCGIRPKLGRLSAVASGTGFQDFYIEHEEGFPGFINLLGIESPGLTSCLAIAEEVEQKLY